MLKFVGIAAAVMVLALVAFLARTFLRPTGSPLPPRDSDAVIVGVELSRTGMTAFDQSFYSLHTDKDGALLFSAATWLGEEKQEITGEAVDAACLDAVLAAAEELGLTKPQLVTSSNQSDGESCTLYFTWSDGTRTWRQLAPAREADPMEEIFQGFMTEE